MNFIRYFNIGTWLGLGCGFLLVLMGAMTELALGGFRSIGEDARQVLRWDKVQGPRRRHAQRHDARQFAANDRMGSRLRSSLHGPLTTLMHSSAMEH